MHMILFRTTEAEMAGKTKFFYAAPDFCTVKRNHFQILPEMKMEKEMDIQNLRSDTEQAGEEMLQETARRALNPLRYLGCYKTGRAHRLPVTP